jgi:rhodanese-related sulfurtransferase
MFTKKTFGVPTISIEDVERQLGQSGVFIFDANPERVWAHGHVPGAKNVDPADYTPADLPADKNATLIFYCSDPSCGAGPYAAQRAKKMGYANVFVMRDGISGWWAQNKRVEL